MEDMGDIFHRLQMAMYHNLHPFLDVASSILYVDFGTISSPETKSNHFKISNMSMNIMSMDVFVQTF